jgi:hypothetical protein
MTADRREGRRGPRRLEVVTNTSDAQERAQSVQEICRLFDIAGREPEVIATLNAGMHPLRTAQAAKPAMTTLTPAKARAIVYRSARAGDAGLSGAGHQAREGLS